MDKFNAAFDKLFKPTFSAVFISNLNKVWQTIGPDALPLCDSNAEAIEMCLDADRLLMYGSKQSNDELNKLLVEFDFGTIVRELTTKVSLY